MNKTDEIRSSREKTKKFIPPNLTRATSAMCHNQVPGWYNLLSKHNSQSILELFNHTSRRRSRQQEKGKQNLHQVSLLDHFPISYPASISARHAALCKDGMPHTKIGRNKQGELGLSSDEAQGLWLFGHFSSVWFVLQLSGVLDGWTIDHRDEGGGRIRMCMNFLAQKLLLRG